MTCHHREEVVSDIYASDQLVKRMRMQPRESLCLTLKYYDDKFANA